MYQAQVVPPHFLIGPQLIPSRLIALVKMVVVEPYMVVLVPIINHRANC
jgi:hypothetical protein